MLSLAAQALAPSSTPPPSWTPANQLACAALGPIDQTPTAFDLDLVGRKTATATIAAAADSAFARTSSISVATAPAGGGARLIGIATGAAQYRLVLTPATGAGARLQVFALENGVAGDLLMQGFCGARGGKPLSIRKLATLNSTDGVPPSPAWAIRPLPQRLPDRACVVLGEDRRPRALSYAVTNAAGNELSLAYRADAADLLGTAAASAGGTQFHLVSPARRMVSVTTMIEAVDPPAYVHIAFERSGTWIDATRGGRVVAVGACGAALPMLVGPPIGAVSP